MKKIIIFNICTLLCAAVYAQRGDGTNVTAGRGGDAILHLNFKGIYSSATINGYVRDAAFYNDTCYLVSGDGKKILMTKSNGTAVTNYFSSVNLNGAMNIYADDTYVLVLDFDYLRFYTKRGVLKYSIPVAAEVWYRYFWVKSKQEIMLVSDNKILVYDYNTRVLLKSHTLDYSILSNGYNFVNDGNKLYNVGSKLLSYEYRAGAIFESDLTTPAYHSLISGESGNYLSCSYRDVFYCFNYFDRSRGFAVKYFDFSTPKYFGSFLPVSKNPTNDDFIAESGTPFLKIFIGGSSGRQVGIYVLNISLNKVEFYMLE